MALTGAFSEGAFRPNYSRSVALSVLTSTLSVGSSLVTTVLVYRALVGATGLEAFGALTMMLSLVGYLGFVEFGLNFGAARFLAAAAARQDKGEFSRILATTFRLNLVVMAIVGALGIGGYFAFGLLPERFAGIQDQHVVWLAIVAWQASLFLFRTFTAALIGVQRLWETNIINASTSLLASVIALILIARGLGLVALPLANLIAGCIGGAVTVVRVGWVGFKTALLGPVDWATIKAMFSFNVFATIGGLLWTLEGTLDQWVTAGRLGAAAAGTVFLLFRFPALAATFLSRLSESSTPSITGLIAEGETSRARDALHALFEVTMAGLLVVGVMWVATGHTVLELWLGSRLSAGRWALTFFGFGAMAHIPLMVILNGWMGLGRLRGYTVALLAQVACKYLLFLVLIPTAGVVAAPASTLATMPALMLWEARRLARLGLLDARRIAIVTLRCLLFGGGLLCGAFAWEKIDPFTGAPLRQLIVTTILMGPPTVVVSYFGLVSREVRQRIYRYLGFEWSRATALFGH